MLTGRSAATVLLSLYKKRLPHEAVADRHLCNHTHDEVVAWTSMAPPRRAISKILRPGL